MSVRVGNKKLPTFLAIDFFSGAGGTTRGLIDAGGYVIAGIDNDLPLRKDVYRKQQEHHA